MDVIVDKDPNSIDNIVELLSENGFIPIYENGRIKAIKDRGRDIRIDLYTRDEVGILSVEEIIKHSLKVKILHNSKEERYVRVAHPVHLVIMKLMAGRDKDYEDIINIIESIYGTTDRFFEYGKDILNEIFSEDHILNLRRGLENLMGLHIKEYGENNKHRLRK
ncbi:MAG: hypothetical protein ARM1_0533 [Candidatus Micrarchaeota archaeon]|nr:MAG: hypothetical protein ARM1_0533 [Candidatus Micrarchaeota archaeon]